jgi:hypothetical protein
VFGVTQRGELVAMVVPSSQRTMKCKVRCMQMVDHCGSCCTTAGVALRLAGVNSCACWNSGAAGIPFGTLTTPYRLCINMCEAGQHDVTACWCAS